MAPSPYATSSSVVAAHRGLAGARAPRAVTGQNGAVRVREPHALRGGGERARAEACETHLHLVRPRVDSPQPSVKRALSARRRWRRRRSAAEETFPTVVGRPKAERVAGWQVERPVPGSYAGDGQGPDACEDPLLTTQTPPLPTARSVGILPTPKVPTTFLVCGSIFEIVLSSAFRTHTAPSPTATALGVLPTPITVSTRFVRGLMATTELAGASGTSADPPRLQLDDDCCDRAREDQRSRGDEHPATPDEPAPSADAWRLQPQRFACRIDEVDAGGEALGLVLGQSAPDDGVEDGIGLKRLWILVHVRPQRLRFGLPMERRLPGQALVEQAGEGVLVAATVDLFAADLLGGEVVERADDLARSRWTAPPACLVRPKSARYASPSSSRSTLAGLTSRWTRPRRMGDVQGLGDLDGRCANARSGSSFFSRASRVFRSSPST